MKAARLHFLALALLALAAMPGAAAPQAGPCMPGAAYDSACDADQNGTIDVADIQLTAGHWNQTGTWVSDNQHNHLGQTWTGTNNPLKLTGSFAAPDYAPLVLSNTSAHGLRISSAASDGVGVVQTGANGLYVYSAGANGLYVYSAGGDGVFVNRAGNPSTWNSATSTSGFEVAGAQGNGVYVGRADGSGVLVNSAGVNGVQVDLASQDGLFVCRTGSASSCMASSSNNGVEIGNAQDNGVGVSWAGSAGLYVNSAGHSGVDVAGNSYAGYFYGDIFVYGDCTGCLQANFAVNAGDRALQAGDVVSILGVTPANFDTGLALWQVTQTQPGQAVVGVVAGRAELVTEAEHRPTETGKRLVPRDGAAQPGEYVTIVYSGPMQVKVAPGESAIVSGTRLTAAANGMVRPLGTIKVQLAGSEGTADISEGAPLIGVALEPAKDGTVWVLVNPQ